MSGSKCKSCGVASISVLFKISYCKIKNIYFLFAFYDKYYKPITVQYYIANCVSWVLRPTCWIYKQIRLTNAVSEQNSFVCRGLSVIRKQFKCWEAPPNQALLLLK